MSSWKSKFDNYKVLLNELDNQREMGQTGLRFNRSVIIASDIAEQYFCEKKVEMQYLHGKIVTEAKIDGTEGHEKLLEGAAEVENEELWKKIDESETILALEWFLLARYDDVLIGGKPDAVLFQKGKPLVVFEFKFSKSGVAYPAHHVQARTYSVLLENMGFDTSALYYCIVVADPRIRGDNGLQQRVMRALMENGYEESAFSIENANIYCNKFIRQMADENLVWAIDYWKKNREAFPTENKNKCVRCEYHDRCFEE
jgi:CRISPR/Cas system-associated exonuclease Cas4 (RecB family)